MKTNNHTFAIILLLVSLSSLFTISGCKPDDPSDNEVAKKKLTSGVWKISQVTVDGVDQISLFTGMTLKFNPTHYFTTDGVPVWAPSGTWTFADNTGKLLTREDGIQLTVTSLTESELIFTMPWDKTTYSGGRERSVPGPHTFRFGK